MSAPQILPSAGIQPEIVIPAVPDDERVWVPQAKDVWFRPLLLNTVTGGWCNLLRVRKSGMLHRHRHPMIVVGYVIKGSGATSSTTGSRPKAASCTSRRVRSTRWSCPRTVRK